MASRRDALIAWGVLFYCVLAAAFLARLPMVEHLGRLLPHSIVPIVLTVVGPAILFSAGIDAWPVVLVLLALIAAFVSLAYFAWRRSASTEWFAVWIICAVVVWVGSGWLLVAFAV